MQLEVNPLKQYFRRPSIYLRLPSNGQDYTPNMFKKAENDEYPVYPMTAIDEITSKTPDALYNGNAIVSIISSCMPHINDPWQINSCDLDAILIAIKTASNGSKMEIETTCPACNTTSKYDVNLTGLLRELKYPDYHIEYRFNDLIFKFKPLSFKDLNIINNKQFEFQKMLSNIDNIENIDEKITKSKQIITLIAELGIQMVTNSIEYIKLPTTMVTDKKFIVEFLTNCDKNTYSEIKDKVMDLKAKGDMKPLNTKCMNCSHEYLQPFTLNFTDFFE